MRTHTQEFKDGLKAYGRQFNEVVSSSYEDGGQTIFVSLGQSKINRIQYSVDATLMKSVMTKLVVELTEKLDDRCSGIGYQLFLKDVYNSSINLSGIITEIEELKDTKSYRYTCYDNMIKAMVDYQPPKKVTTDNTFISGKTYYEYNNGKYSVYTGPTSGVIPYAIPLYEDITYPITIRSYLDAIGQHLHIGFADYNNTFTNYDKLITSEHYVDSNGASLGYTFRDVLDDICEAIGGFIVTDYNGNLKIREITNTNDTIDEAFLSDKNVNMYKKVGPYNYVTLSRASDSDNIHYPTTTPQTPIEIKISDNKILEQNNREDFIQGIYNKINGLEFYLNNMRTTGILYYEIGDKFNVSIDGTTYSCLMLSDDIVRTTGLKETIITDEPNVSVSEYVYSGINNKTTIVSNNAYTKAVQNENAINNIINGSQTLNSLNVTNNVTTGGTTTTNSLSVTNDATISGSVTSSGSTISNSTANQKSTIVCERTDTGNSIEFGVGAGGTNRGIFDTNLNRWVLYTDGTNVYLDGTKTTEITKATAISQSDFITLNNGFSVKHYNMNKLGNHVFGNIVIEATNNIGSGGVIVGSIKSGYITKTSYFTFCGLGSTDYKVDGIGYTYIGSGGAFSVSNTSGTSNAKFIVLEFNYVTA